MRGQKDWWFASKWSLWVTIVLTYGFVCAQNLTQGVATNFQAIGSPYGACGVPESVLASEAGDFKVRKVSELDYVALNVFNAPNNYQSAGDFGTRPLMGADTVWLGAYDNGRNCGRWVEITLGDECNGQNSGAIGTGICTGGTGWYADSLNGSKLMAIVTDQCSDNNEWCRDIPGHLDIHTQSLNHFRLADDSLIPSLATVDASGSWAAKQWNNREIAWRYIPAPAYVGDVHLWFAQGSGLWWMQVLATNLPNGIHGMDQWVGVDSQGADQWEAATMGGDNGQMWRLPKPSADTLKVRIWDASDSLVGKGRIYWLKVPTSCGATCSAPATPADQGVFYDPTPNNSTAVHFNSVTERLNESLPMHLRVNGQMRVQAWWKGQWLAVNGRL